MGQNVGVLSHTIATPQAHAPKVKGSRELFSGGQGVKADFSRFLTPVADRLTEHMGVTPPCSVASYNYYVLTLQSY